MESEPVLTPSPKEGREEGKKKNYGRSLHTFMEPVDFPLSKLGIYCSRMYRKDSYMYGVAVESK